MKPKKEYIVLALLIIALSAYLIAHKQGSVHYSLPQLKKLDTENISRLSIKKGGSTVTLQKNDGNWVILPEKFPADSALVNRMIDKISALSLTALASGGGYGSVYGLGGSGEIDISAYHNGKVVRSLELGKAASGNRQTFVKLAGDKRVFYAGGDLRYAFNKSIHDLRDKTVLSFDDDNINGITVEKDKRKEVFVRERPRTVAKHKGNAGETALRWQTAAGAAVNGGKLDEIVSTLSNLSCESFVSSKTKKDFTHPIYEIILRGKKAYSLSLFRRSGGKYPAISSQSDYPFYLESWQAESLLKDLNTLSTTGKTGAAKGRGKKSRV